MNLDEVNPFHCSVSVAAAGRISLVQLLFP
jgi:hypothetical protein